MQILEIYREYGIPQNLQMHMLRVASCSKLIIDNWTGEPVNSYSLYRVLLLHDMGNIVKIPEEEYSDILFKINREKYFGLYGSNDHRVSLEIGRELGLTDAELVLMQNKIFINNEQILISGDNETMIGAYCDQRVAPEGVLPLMERLLEAKERYKDRPGTSMNNPRTDLLIQCAAKIESIIMKNCIISPDEINDSTINDNIEYFKRYDLENEE